MQQCVDSIITLPNPAETQFIYRTINQNAVTSPVSCDALDVRLPTEVCPQDSQKG